MKIGIGIDTGGAWNIRFDRVKRQSNRDSPVVLFSKGKTELHYNCKSTFRCVSKVGKL